MQRSDLFNLNYYRQADFTGSRGNICYHVSLKEENEPQLLLQWWKGPYATDTTEEDKQEKFFPYTNEGLDQIAAFINEMDTEPLKGSLFEEVMKERERDHPENRGRI